MKNVTLAVIGIIVVVGGILLSGTLFTITEREQALVLRVGEPRRVLQEPGLKVKLPLIEDIVRFDQRILDYDADAEEVPTQDQKQLVVDAFARYRIVEPLVFFRSVSNEAGWESRLGRIINSNLRSVFGQVTLATLVTPERANLMAQIAERVKAESQTFGVDVIDVRIKRIDLPAENSQAIFRRMQTQREQEARKIRAEGDKESRSIRADADKQAIIIRANAQREAQATRGEGEAQAQEIYNDAYGRDPEFYFFWDSMRALKEGLQGNTTSFIGPPEGDFFRYFGDAEGRVTPPRRN